MNILQTIFNDHYEEMLYILHPRQAVIADLTQWQATVVPLTEFFPTHPGFFLYIISVSFLLFHSATAFLTRLSISKRALWHSFGYFLAP